MTWLFLQLFLWCLYWWIYLHVFHKRISVSYREKTGIISKDSENSQSAHPYICQTRSQMVRKRWTLTIHLSAQVSRVPKKKQGKCLPNHNVVNFHMIHAPCRGLHLTKSAREYKTVKEEDFKSYPENEKLKSISSCRRVSRTDLYFDFSLAK